MYILAGSRPYGGKNVTTGPMKNASQGSRFSSLSEYQDYVPGEMVLSSGKAMGTDLQIRSHILPPEQDPAPAPAIPQHTLTFVYAGAIEGAHRWAEGPWEPFDLRAEGHVTTRPAGCSVSLRWTADKPVHTTSLYLAPGRLEDVGLQMGMAPARVELKTTFSRADPVLESLARALRHVAASDDAEDPLYLQTALQSITVRLLRHHSVTPPNEREEPGRLSRNRVRRVERFVRAHLDSDLSLDDLAEAVTLSKYHFSRRFKKRTGQSPYQFVIYERVRAAQRLLRKTTRPLAQIALDVGFGSQSHFTRTFKQHTGVPPGQYRSLWR